jgi:hypothetical protein
VICSRLIFSVPICTCHDLLFRHQLVSFAFRNHNLKILHHEMAGTSRQQQY